jgi:hypothetical protein
MRIRALVLVSVIAAAGAATASGSAKAQGMQDHMRPGMMQRGAEQQGGGGMMCPMMQSGMMQHEMTQGDMMHGGMMQGSMMRNGMMGGGMGALFGSRVTPVMNLSVEDVRAYLASRLERFGSKRLKVGDVKSDDATITTDIVTVDNSLVQRLKVDRHTGAITQES